MVNGRSILRCSAAAQSWTLTQPGERDESIPYGSYRLKIHAQPKQYLTLGGYSFDYSTRVLVNGSKVLEIGKVGASAAESEPRIDYMLIPIYTGEDGKVEVVCQYANSCTAKAAV